MIDVCAAASSLAGGPVSASAVVSHNIHAAIRRLERGGKILLKVTRS
jgi:hypothetical protein